MKKKILSIVLAIIMVLSVMPLTAFSSFAAGYDKPVANVEEVTAAGYDYAVKYTIAKEASESYNDWAADIIITADKDVAAGAVTFRGQYGSYDKSLAAPAMTAGEEYSLLAALDENITYWDLANAVKEFTCGVINNALTEDTTFTIRVVLSNGTETLEVEGSEVNKTVNETVEPVANVEEVTAAGYDYAVKYTIATEGSANYNDWAADIIITADKDVAAGAVTFRGQYGSYDKSLAAPAMTAGEEYSLLAALGENITYWDLANAVKEFTCGVINNALTEDTTFTIRVVLSNGTETLDVEGSDAEKELEAVNVKPIANVEETTIAGLDYAVIYSVAEAGSEYYNDWKADIVIVADKDVAAGDVTLAGQYGSYDLTELEPFAMTAGKEISLTEKFDAELTCADLINSVKEFTCGIRNNNLANNTTFTIKIVLTNGTETLEVEGSTVEKALEPAVEIYDIKVTNGATVKQAINPAKSTRYQIATVKIKEANGINANGDWFVYWVDEDGKIVSTYSTYNFFAVEDRTLTPVYVSKDVYQAERAKGILVTDIVRADSNEDGTVTLFAERSASKAAVGNSIKQHGVIYTTDAAQKDSLTINNNSDEVCKVASTKTATDLTGLFRTTIRPDEGDTVYAVSYLIDANNEAHYGEVKEIEIADEISTLSVSCALFETELVQADEVIPAEEEAPTVTEPAAAGSMLKGIISSLINAIIELVQFVISMF